MRRVVAAVLIVGVLLMSIPLPAHADTDDGVITRYDLTATTVRDGTTTVVIDFTIDFGTTPRHGPYVTLPIRQEIQGDPDHYRAIDIDDVTAGSTSGAPANVATDTDNGALQIKVGDEDQEVRGEQSYRLGYTARGLVNPDVAGPDGPADEIYWNAIGTQWEIPLQNITVTLVGPADTVRSTCYAGDPSDRTTCEHDTPEDDQVSFTQPELAAGQGMTVVAAWPVGTFIGAEPRLIPRRNLGNTFTTNGGTIGASVIVAVLGAALVVLRSRRRGRDEQYAGVTPGSIPRGAGGERSPAAVEPVSRRGEIAVAFTPPRGVQPGVMGTLIDSRAQSRDVTATVVDLAVRGHLRIEEMPKPETKRAQPDWRLVKLTSSDPVAPWEQDLLDAIFSGGMPATRFGRLADRVFGDDQEDSITLSELRGSFAGTLKRSQKSLYAEVTRRGWFRKDPSTLRNRAYLLATVTIVVGVLATIGLAIAVGWGLLGLAVIAIGIVGMIFARVTPGRTAKGTALLVQSRGFEKYLKTAEADQVRFEEGVDVFSRYLPYAIVFGVAERWAKVFSDLAAQGRYGLEPGWYVGPSGHHAGLLASGGFSDSLTAFSSAAGSAMTTATSGSSGGSGFSGGVGGGVGGGGGGSW